MQVGCTGALERGARPQLVIEFGPQRLGKCAHGEARSVVLLRDVHGDQLLGGIGHDRARRLGRLRVGKMPGVRQDAVLQIARVGTGA